MLHHSHICWGYGEFQTVSVVPAFVLTPISSPVCRYAHLRAFQCVDLSDALVWWAGSLLLNYSCLTCDFKGTDPEVSPHCHDADVTPLHDCLASHFLGPYQAGGPWALLIWKASFIFSVLLVRGFKLKISALVDRLQWLMPMKSVLPGTGMRDPEGQQAVQSLSPRGLQGRWNLSHCAQGRECLWGR